jgi:hypothetical protein
MSSNPAVINSDSPLNQRAIASMGSRVSVSGLNLPVSQAVSLPGSLKQELLLVPSTTIPVWGSIFFIDIRETNIVLHNTALQFVVSPVTGTGLTGAFSPAAFFFTRIDVIIGSQIIDSIFPAEAFLRNQMLNFDENLVGINNAMGRYDSLAQRTMLSSQTGTNTFYLNLNSFLDETKLTLLSRQHNIQFRITLDTLPNVFTATAGVLTGANILSCTAISKITRLDMVTASKRLQDMTVSPYHYLFHETRYSIYNLIAGSTTVNTIMAGVTGRISTLLFTIRTSSVNNNAYAFQPITQFAILDAASQNIVGGAPIPASFASQLYNKDLCKSSYYSQNVFSLNNQGANFYAFSFSSDHLGSLTTGQMLNSRVFTGNEQLVITFASPIPVNYILDVYAYNESILTQTTEGCTKSSM